MFYLFAFLLTSLFVSLFLSSKCFFFFLSVSFSSVFYLFAFLLTSLFVSLFLSSKCFFFFFICVLLVCFSPYFFPNFNSVSCFPSSQLSLSLSLSLSILFLFLFSLNSLMVIYLIIHILFTSFMFTFPLFDYSFQSILFSFIFFLFWVDKSAVAVEYTDGFSEER